MSRHVLPTAPSPTTTTFTGIASPSINQSIKNNNYISSSSLSLGLQQHLLRVPVQHIDLIDEASHFVLQKIRVVVFVGGIGIVHYYLLLVVLVEDQVNHYD